MILIAGHILTEPGTREAAVRAFSSMVERARKHDGCLDLSISADLLDALEGKPGNVRANNDALIALASRQPYYRTFAD